MPEQPDHPTRVVTMRPSKSRRFGRRGHVLWIDTSDQNSTSHMDLPIEGSIVFGLILVADIVLLALSSHFGTAPRDLIRWLGGAVLAASIVLGGLYLVFVGGARLFIDALNSIGTAGQRPIRPTARFSVALIGVGIGAIAGTSVVIYGPVDFVAVVVLLWMSARVGLGSRTSGRPRALRHLVAAGLLIAAATAAAVGYLLLNHA
jgi:hypothetical protein